MSDHRFTDIRARVKSRYADGLGAQFREDAQAIRDLETLLCYIDMGERGSPPGDTPAPDYQRTVTRVELIDHRTGAEPFGRVFSAWDCRVALSYQDGGRTLKVFVDGEAPPPREEKQ